MQRRGHPNTVFTRFYKQLVRGLTTLLITFSAKCFPIAEKFTTPIIFGYVDTDLEKSVSEPMMMKIMRPY